MDLIQRFSELAGRDGRQQHPDEHFPRAQAAQRRRRQPELDFGGAKRNDVPIAQPRGFLRLAVDSGQRVRGRFQDKALSFLEANTEMFVPDSRLIEAQVVFTGAPDQKRKMADDLNVTRHFSGKNGKLNHHQSRRATKIRSPG
jgi:hypothetical protein